MIIPKIIHYCWFGNGEKSNLIKKCMSTWARLNDFEIKEWNDTNVNFDSHPYLKEAYKQKKYAFISDYIRLKVLYEHGGIYLDTDVEIKKDIDRFRQYSFFIGFMYDCLLGTAVIGAEKNSLVIKNLLDIYDNLNLENTANNNLVTKYFLENYPNFKLDNREQEIEYNTVVFPKEYFERPTFSKKSGYTVHHFAGSWQEKKENEKVKKYLKLFLGDIIYKKIAHKKALPKTPFYNVYLQHRKKRFI